MSPLVPSRSKRSMTAPRGYFKSAGSVVGSLTCWYECTGEWREPQPGEFYLSGALPEVWQMPTPLPSSGLPVEGSDPPRWKKDALEFWIMRRVPDPPTEVVVKGFRYRLSGAVR